MKSDAPESKQRVINTLKYRVIRNEIRCSMSNHTAPERSKQRVINSQVFQKYRELSLKQGMKSGAPEEYINSTTKYKRVINSTLKQGIKSSVPEE